MTTPVGRPERKRDQLQKIHYLGAPIERARGDEREIMEARAEEVDSANRAYAEADKLVRGEVKEKKN